MFYLLIYACIAIIAVFIVKLAYRNWNDSIHGAIISICFIGCATVLAAVFASLKETIRQEKMVSVIAVEENFKPYDLFALTGGSQDERTFRSLTNLGKYGYQYSFNNYDYYNQTFKNEAILGSEAMPQNPTQWLILNSEALVYEIYRMIFSNSLFKNHVVRSRGTGAYPFLTDALTIKLPTDTVHAQFSDKDFNFKMFKWHLANGESFRCPLPPGTKIQIQSTKNVPKGRHDQDTSQYVTLSLTKDRYFNIQFKVHAIEYSKLQVPLKNLKSKKLFAYSVLIEYDAKFEKLTSGSPTSREYIAWADSMFEVVKKRYGWNDGD